MNYFDLEESDFVPVKQLRRSQPVASVGPASVMVRVGSTIACAALATLLGMGSVESTKPDLRRFARTSDVRASPKVTRVQARGAKNVRHLLVEVPDEGETAPDPDYGF